MWYSGVCGMTRGFMRLGMSEHDDTPGAVLYGSLKGVVGPNICVLNSGVTR